MSNTLAEPSIFSDLDLARRLEEAEGCNGARFVEARAKAFPERGAEWVRLAGVYAMYDGALSPVTQTFGLGLFQPVTGAGLDEIERFFRERGAPVFHEVSPLAGISVLRLLNERNYRPVELSSVMCRPIQTSLDSTQLSSDRLRVRPVGKDDHELWAQIAARGWNDAPHLSEFLLELGRVNPFRADGIPFLAEMDGQAIAAAMLSINAGVALLAGACTIPVWRQQGAQLALLDSRLRCAAERGCDIAMMCAEPGTPSQRNAERHGFRIVYTRIKWQLA